MYLYQITNDREREYIKNYVSKVEKTGILFNLFLKFELIIPFMLFKVSIPQFVKAYGYSGSNKYEFGFMYSDVDKGYSFKGIIPLQG